MMTSSGLAADQAAQQKMDKYSMLLSTHIFSPVAVETAGTWNGLAIELVQEIGRRITAITEDARETVFLSSACPWPFNRGTWSPSKTQRPPNESPLRQLTLFFKGFNIYAHRLCAGGHKNDANNNNNNNTRITLTHMVYTVSRVNKSQTPHAE